MQTNIHTQSFDKHRELINPSKIMIEMIEFMKTMFTRFVLLSFEIFVHDN